MNVSYVDYFTGDYNINPYTGMGTDNWDNEHCRKLVNAVLVTSVRSGNSGVYQEVLKGKAESLRKEQQTQQNSISLSKQTAPLTNGMSADFIASVFDNVLNGSRKAFAKADTIYHSTWDNGQNSDLERLYAVEDGNLNWVYDEWRMVIFQLGDGRRLVSIMRRIDLKYAVEFAVNSGTMDLTKFVCFVTK